jgi:hypothetical protein
MSLGTRILFSLDFNAVDGAGNSYIKYRAGESYEVTEETTRLVAAGIAESIVVPDVAADGAASAPSAPSAPSASASASASATAISP